MLDIHPDFLASSIEGGWYSSDLMEKIAQTGSIDYDEVPAHVKAVYKTAHDISPEYHIRTQAAFQKHIHSAISKTCNFPESASQEDVKRVYLLAWSLGCKGVTVYRDGSRDEQVLSFGNTPQTSQEAPGGVVIPDPSTGPGVMVSPLQGATGKAPEVSPITLPSELDATVHNVRTPLGKLHAVVGFWEGRPVEVFGIIGRGATDTLAFTEALGRLASLALRCGIPVKLIADQLIGIGGGTPSVGFGPSRVMSVPDALGRILLKYDGYFGNETEVDENLMILEDISDPTGSAETVMPKDTRTGAVCPECHNVSLFMSEGCTKCVSCGYSAC
jgi:ribonucleoside-diphosphate reductase alpha chain